MSLYYGYKKQEIGIGGLPTTGGEMTGDINMQDNHILTSVDPTQDSHLARKKYVDNHVSNTGGNYLLKIGGVMTGNISMGNNKITTNKNPTGVKDLTRKKYVDDQDNKKLSLTGGNMTGDVTIGSHNIISSTDPTLETHLARKKYIDENISEIKKYVSFPLLKNNNFPIKFHNLFLVEYDSAYDLIFKRNGGKVKELMDYGIEGNNFKQTTTSLQPSLNLESEKEDNKYFLKFNNNRMISDSNLNAITGKKDVINVFIVYKLNSVPSSGSDWLRGGLFGHDNGGYDKFVCFANPTTKELIISGNSGDFVIGRNKANHKNPIASYQTKANAGELNKWICLSIHWNADTTPNTDESSVYCNGKQLTSFTAKTSTGDTKLTIGDIKNNTNSPFDGSIIFFSVYKYEKMSHQEIAFYHYILCNSYNSSTSILTMLITIQ